MRNHPTIRIRLFFCHPFLLLFFYICVTENHRLKKKVHYNFHILAVLLDFGHDLHSQRAPDMHLGRKSEKRTGFQKTTKKAITELQKTTHVPATER